MKTPMPGPWTKNRMVVVFRRERNGREYVRCRTFNRHQIKKIWYPSPRFYMVPVNCAEELGKAIIAAARGEQYGQVPAAGGTISTSSTRRGNGGASRKRTSTRKRTGADPPDAYTKLDAGVVRRLREAA